MLCIALHTGDTALCRVFSVNLCLPAKNFVFFPLFVFFGVFCICVSVFSQALQRRRGAVQCFLGQPVFTNPGFQWRWNPCVLDAFQSN